MCGIVGVVSAGPVDTRVVEAMRDRLAHRGPDHAGIWCSPDRRVCFGHRRLAIIDLDPEANQPLQSHDGRFVVTFNGEIYNYQGLRTQLERDGARFATRSDTEVLVEAYRRWGDAMLEHISGMFAFALWDAKERRLFCARDRAGEKPFYYARTSDAFVFASELKAIAAWPTFERRLDQTALIDFLSLGFVPDPKSIWATARKLAPAHALTVELSGDVFSLGPPKRYWSLRFCPDPSVRDWSEQIRAGLMAAAGEMAVADVPLGTFLSGGVDSSAVTAALSRSGHAVRSFTIGFDDADYDERPWAKQVASCYASAHIERVVSPGDAVAVMDKLLWHFDEPFNDYSYVPTFYLCREARRDITVALSGDGADELFAGYRKYQRLALHSSVEPLVPQALRRGLAAASDHMLPEGNRLRRTLAQYASDHASLLTDGLSLGFREPLLRSVARGPLAATLDHYATGDLVRELLCEAPPHEVGLINAMRHLDFLLTLPGDMLVKVDRASMAVSLEVRAPFLHRSVMETAASIPPGLLATRKQSKEALKRSMQPWLPSPLLYRRKQGFAMPLGRWLTNSKSFASEFLNPLSDGPVAEFLDTRRLGALAQTHLAGTSDFTSHLHSIYVLDRWLRAWMP